MSVETRKFNRKSFPVDAVQVTEENMEDVADWCQGTLEKTEPSEGKPEGERYIQVRVHRPLSPRQTRAFVGDHVLYAGTGYKVYTDRAFQNSFEEVAGQAADAQVQAEKPQPPADLSGQVVTRYRDAESGEMTTEEFADANPSTTIKETVTLDEGGNEIDVVHQARDANNGQWVTAEYAAANPATTVGDSNS